MVTTVIAMTHLRGLGYLLGLQGAALLRGMREGTADRAFVERRIDEIRQLLDDPALNADEGVDASLGDISTNDVYQQWAPEYDGPNTMIDLEEPLIHSILDDLPLGTVLDAACGTGRYAAHLAEKGHRVVGVDASPDMLAVARKRLRDVDLHVAGLEALPLPDDSVDIVVCGLALAHVPDLLPVMAEFARVLRPGGHLVISDAHQLLSYVRPTLARYAEDGAPPSILVEHHRPLSAYLAAALPMGFQVRHCAEPKSPRESRSQLDEPLSDPPPTHVSWEIQGWCPEAAAIANDVPSIVIWHFQLDDEAKSGQ